MLSTLTYYQKNSSLRFSAELMYSNRMKTQDQDISFKLENQTHSVLRDLSQKMAQAVLTLNGLDQKEKEFIQRSVRISTIGSSTRIENAVLTDIEIDWLDTVVASDAKATAYADQRQKIHNKLSKDKERSIDEVAGCRSMLQVIYQQSKELFPLTETTIRGLHSYLMEFYKPAQHYAGKYKVVPNTVVQRELHSKEETSVLVTSAPGPITESAMQELVKWYNQALPEHPWTIAVATEFVFRFLAIHPFQDGNGRLGRGLYLMALLQSKDAIISQLAPCLNIDRQIEKRREEYYLVLRQCSGGKFYQDPRKYKYAPFLNFMIKVINHAVDDFMYYREQFTKISNLNFSSLKVLECFKDKAEMRLTAGQLTETAGLPRRTVNDCLVELLEAGFILQLGKGKGTYYQLVF